MNTQQPICIYICILAFCIIATNSSIYFEYGDRDGVNRKVLMDQCEQNYIAAFRLDKPSQCKV